MRFLIACIFVFLASVASSPSKAAPQSATINGAEISYETCGDEKAAAVVLVHDGLANSALWDGVWPLLCEDYRVVRYDRRGYGRSPATKGTHSPTGDLAEVMRHVGMEHAHLIGAFSGAGLVLDFMIDYGEMIDKLVLATPSISGIQTSAEMIARLQRLEEPIRAGDMDGVIAAINADPHFLAESAAHARKKLEAILRASPHDLGAHPGQRRRSSTREMLPQIYAPTLIVVGTSDDPFNLAVAAAMQKELRAASLQAVLEAGHLFYLEHPGTFAGMVKAFLK